jgi:hypothetical protein
MRQLHPEYFFPSMVQSFTLRDNKAKHIYLEGFEEVRHVFIISVFAPYSKSTF